MTAVDDVEDAPLDPPAAPAAVTKIPYPTLTAGWLTLLAPAVLLSLVLSLFAVILAINGYDRETIIQAGADVPGAGATSLDAELIEWAFVFDSPAIAAGVDVPVSMTNTGQVEHNLAVLREGADPADESRIDEGMVIADLGDVAAGASGSGTLNLDEGEYLVVCLIAGHFNSGMKAPLSVVAS